MKRVVKIRSLMLVAVMVFMLSAWFISNSKAYMFYVETRDKIKIELDTSIGMSLNRRMDSSLSARIMRRFWRGCLYMRMGIRAI